MQLVGPSPSILQMGKWRHGAGEGLAQGHMGLKLLMVTDVRGRVFSGKETAVGLAPGRGSELAVWARGVSQGTGLMGVAGVGD